jgi:large subunit ribosomal protein L20
MARVKRSVASRKRRKKVLDAAKGFVGTRHSRYKVANEAVEHSLVHAYRDRKRRKREMRRLWIMRINAAARSEGLSYNQFVAGCRKAGIELDRKVLADIAVDDPAAFGKIAEQAKTALGAGASSGE